jgi:FkbM family methyltransferase
MDYKKEISNFIDEMKKREKSNLDTIIENIKSSKYVCVFGAGAISYPIISAVRKYTDINIDFLCDNDNSKWGIVFNTGLKCISPVELEKYKGNISIIIATSHYLEIYNQLSEKGYSKIYILTEYRLINQDYFKEGNNLEIIKQNAMKTIDVLEDQRSREILYALIKCWFKLDVMEIEYASFCTNDQYYPSDIIKLSDDECFVDVGAFNGDTIQEFLQKVNYKFRNISAFELDKMNFEELQKMVGLLDNNLKDKITLFNYGLFDKECNVTYETGGSGSQSTCINMIGQANDIGKTVRLSHVMNDEDITFIKMDIEGSELKALHGAEDIIKKQKPKLAICVYHNPEHLWQIPLYIKSIVPGYRIYLRHHTVLEYETVCYAVI